MTEPVRKYVALIDETISAKRTLDDFMHAFLKMFKEETAVLTETEYDVLEALFEDADAYCSDPDLRAKTLDGIGDERFLSGMRDAGEKLRAL